MENNRGPSDEDRIHAGIAEANEEQRLIDEATARLIASQLHEGQWSALYSLSSTGTVDPDRLYDEISRGVMDADVTTIFWYEALAHYVFDKDPIE